MRVVFVFALLLATTSAQAAPPPEKPGLNTAAERAQRLVEAIKTNDPDKALGFFFPKVPFRKVKGIKDPDKYFGYLMDVYRADIELLRSKLAAPDTIEFVSFELGGWKRWVERGKEANRLPYWAAYKSPLVIQDNGQLKTIAVRVMITWGDEWYVTHLTRKKKNEKPEPKFLPQPSRK